MPLTEEEEQQQQNHNPSFIDALLCQEEHHSFDDHTQPVNDAVLVAGNGFFWENDDDDEILSLISKQTRTLLPLLESPRNDAVSWIRRVSAFYNFAALTTVLAVNYFDRFTTSTRFRRDDSKPWMTHLTAVASLSLAAKMDETQVPLLIDLQVEESKFVFEAKTIQRMELLVLSTLEWRMNPVTPISFFEHIVRRIGLKRPLHWEFLWRCERVLLSLIQDSRVMSYLPSTLAAATMIHVFKEIEPLNSTEYMNQLMSLLKISEGEVNECYELMLKLLVLQDGIYNLCQKRKRVSEPPSSPGGVIDASFSCDDSSNDSWAAAASSVMLSLEPVFKRSKAQDQQMRLPSVNRVSIDVLNSPR